MLKFFLNSLDSIPPLILLIFALIRGNILWRRDYVFWFIVVQFFLNTIAYIMDKWLEMDNLFLYHANCTLSFLILSLYFISILSIKRIDIIIGVGLLIFSVFFVVNSLKWENISTFNSHTFGLASFGLVSYCLIYYLENLIQPATKNIAKSRDFWYVTGIFTYYVCSFFIFITYRKLTQNNTKNLGVLWQTHNAVFFIMCVYLLIGLICKPSPKKYKL